MSRFLSLFTLCLFVAAATLGAFSGGVWAALGIAGALFLYAGAWAIRKRLPKPRPQILAFALIALALSAILNLFSTQPELSWQTWMELATIFLPLSLLSSAAIPKHAAHRHLFEILTLAIMTGALLLGCELALQGPLLSLLHAPDKAVLTRYNRGVSYLVVLAMPVMAALWISKQRWLLAFFIVVLLVPASFTDSRAAKLALILALITVAVAHFWPVLVRRVLTLSIILSIAWPFAVQKIFLAYFGWLSHLPASWRARMEIWDFMSYRILERPLLGWGLGTSHTLSPQKPHGALYIFATGPAAHPHCALIQLWVELGLPGLILGLAFALVTLRLAACRGAKTAPFALGAWIAGFSLAMITYDLWTDSLWAAFALTALAFGILERQIKEKRAEKA